MPTVKLNVADAAQRARTMFVAGDWRDLSRSDVAVEALGEPFDVVLAAETLYNIESLPAFVAVLRRCLSRSGVALLATKRYYFGVGGGTQALIDLLGADLQMSEVASFQDGRSNVREILRVEWKN